MKEHAHTLTNIEIDDSGIVDEYKEFSNIDFSNSFKKLEKPDYEIKASQKALTNTTTVGKEDNMKGSRAASYVSELTSGYDATVQDDYEAGQGQKGQAGKGHEEAVALSNNWENDKRDAIGRAAAAKLRRTAASLNKLADMYEKGAVDDEDLEAVDAANEDEEMFEELDDEELEEEAGCKREASHPLEHDDKKDDPDANMSSQTGDDEWIDIGPGEFDDKRDEVGRAAA